MVGVVPTHCRIVDNPKVIMMQDQCIQAKENEQARANNDASSKEIVDKLTAENVKLKHMVISLDQKIDRIKKKYEERLKQAKSESKIHEMKNTIKRLHKKIKDMESEKQILQRQVDMAPSSSNNRFIFSSEGQENGHLGSTSMQRSDIPLRRPVIYKQDETVDILIRASSEDLGFSNGKPVVTYVIYKSLLHWGLFEAEKTHVFDCLIYVFGSAICKEEDNKHIAYWLSVTSTLLFLLQKSLSSGSAKTPKPTAFLSDHKSASYPDQEFVRQVDAKYPALLFNMQLTAFVEKAYGVVRDNLKKELSRHISCCIESARSKGNNTAPSMYWQHIIEALNDMLKTLKENHVPTVLVQMIFAQVFRYINVQLFNSLLIHVECCSFSNGEYLKAGLAELEQWCIHATKEYAGSSWDGLKHTRQAVKFLVIHEKSKISYHDIIKDYCSILSVQQLHKICTHYKDDIYQNPHETSTVISYLKDMSEDLDNSNSNSFLLIDDPSIPFSVDDLINSLNVKDFVEMKLTYCSLVNNPHFKFLLE